MLSDKTQWTYGAEHEWADHSRWTKLPKGFMHNRKDHTIVNSNGIANDPTDHCYHFGGEINTPPTTLEGQVDCLRTLKRLLPDAKVNYRSNLHIHIRVPGLRDDLKALKRVQTYIHQYMPMALPIIEPLPKPTHWDYKGEELKGALRRWRRRRVSHQTLLTQKRLDYQLAATTPWSFFVREVPEGKRPLWHLQPRLCVSLRQMLETDTIEFRHFPGTLDEEELRNCLIWCREFTVVALANAPIMLLLTWARSVKFPPFTPYVHWMEQRYRATVHDGSITKEVIVANIRKFLDEDARALSRK